MDEELERFKQAINLAELARAEGYELDRSQSSRSIVAMKHSNGDKVIIATDLATFSWTPGFSSGPLPLEFPG